MSESPDTGPAPLPSREKLIEAAARVYACLGFRGATTRRIAEEAGVNEVTLFRLFGSKAALIDAAVRQGTDTSIGPAATLPDEPVAPLRELTAWCEAELAMLRERRSLLRQSFSEASERPEILPCVATGPNHAGRELKRYMTRLYQLGFVEGAARRSAGRDEEAHAAGAMLMAALMGDAMARDLMPDLYPQPAERAAGLYVRLFLRAIRCREE